MFVGGVVWFATTFGSTFFCSASLDSRTSHSLQLHTAPEGVVSDLLQSVRDYDGFKLLTTEESVRTNYF